MKIKICGIFREDDIDYINEARPDFLGFVFAPSRREVSPALAARLARRLADGIAAVGVFVNAPLETISALYGDGVISFAQLHGSEDDVYIERLKEESRKPGREPLRVIKTLMSAEFEKAAETPSAQKRMARNADFYLVDSGAGSGKTFNWNIVRQGSPCASRLLAEGKPWFLAGGITLDNIKEAASFNPFCVDISGGAESEGVKDREKIMRLCAAAREVN